MNKYVYYIISIFIYQFFLWGLYFILTYGFHYFDNDTIYIPENPLIVAIIIILPFIHPVIYYSLTKSFCIKKEPNIMNYILPCIIYIIVNVVITVISIRIILYITAPQSFFDTTGLCETIFAIINTFSFIVITITIGCIDIIKRRTNNIKECSKMN